MRETGRGIHGGGSDGALKAISRALIVYHESPFMRLRHMLGNRRRLIGAAPTPIQVTPSSSIDCPPLRDQQHHHRSA
jgi:hypothetical protein